MTCEECRERFTELVANSLSPQLEAELRAHLDSCRDCGQMLVDFRAVVGAVRELPELAPPPALRERVRKAVQEKATERGQVPRLQRVRYALAGVAAAAAAIVIVWAGMRDYGGEEGFGLGLPPTKVELEAIERQPVAEEAPREPQIQEDLLARGAVRQGAAAERAGEVAPAVGAQAKTVSAPVTGAMARERPVRPGMAERDAAPQEAAAEEAVAPVEPKPAEVTEAPASAHEEETAPSGPKEEQAEVAAEEPLHFAASDAMVPPKARPWPPPSVDINVVPPAQRVVGEVVAATVIVKPGTDFPIATVSAESSAGLKILGTDDGVIYRGPLMSGQRTDLSVRMIAKQAGTHTLTVRLQSSDPPLNTRLVQPIIGFRLPLPPAQRMIRLNFENTPMREALASIAAESGMNVIITEEVDSETVNKDFSAGVPARAALAIVAEAGGYRVRERDGRYFVEKQ